MREQEGRGSGNGLEELDHGSQENVRSVVGETEASGQDQGPDMVGVGQQEEEGGRGEGRQDEAGEVREEVERMAALRGVIRRAGVQGRNVSMEQWEKTGDGVAKIGNRRYRVRKKVSAAKSCAGGIVEWGEYQNKQKALEAAKGMNEAAKEIIAEEYRKLKRRRLGQEEESQDDRPP